MPETRTLVDAYLAARDALYAHCGYVEDWRAIPLEDSTASYWAVDPRECEWCRWSPQEAALRHWLATDDYGPYADVLYEDEIYTQRFLPRWVYRGALYTLVCVDTHVDLNKFLRIFATNKECTVGATAGGR